MKKIILLFISIFLISGCSMQYEVHLDEYQIEETIKGTFDNDIYEVANNITGDGYYLEKEIVDRYIPAYSDFRDFYDIEIIDSHNKNQHEFRLLVRPYINPR